MASYARRTYLSDRPTETSSLLFLAMYKLATGSFGFKQGYSHHKKTKKLPQAKKNVLADPTPGFQLSLGLNTAADL